MLRGFDLLCGAAQPAMSEGNLQYAALIFI